MIPLAFLGKKVAKSLLTKLNRDFCILFMTGKTPLEARHRGNPEFEGYKKRTSMFLPLPPKHPEQLDV